jgi:hypothetical protein
MDAETQAKLVAGMHRDLGAAYTLIAGVLACLPIPVLLPRNAAAEPEIAILAMSRTWELADLEWALPKLVVGRVRDMTLAWLTAYELAVAASEHGPAEWRVRGLDAQILIVKSSARYIDRFLETRGYGRDW